jgi:ubiquitin-activating enzyme E1
VVVLVDSTLDQQLLINDTCHNLNIPFISSETRGVFGSLFCDFGEKFVVLEINDEPPKSHFISAISQVSLALTKQQYSKPF